MKNFMGWDIKEESAYPGGPTKFSLEHNGQLVTRNTYLLIVAYIMNNLGNRYNCVVSK